MKKLKIPKKRETSPVIEWNQETFSALIQDVPASELPPFAVARAFNVLLFGQYAEVRPGTRLWTSRNIPSAPEADAEISAGGRPISPIPSPDGRSDYAATKSGTTVTKTEGEDFTEADLYSYFLWPDGIRDLIIGIYPDGDRIEVKSAELHEAATAESPARIQRPVNGVYWHRKSRSLFWHIGNKVYFTDFQVSLFREVANYSSAQPSNLKSNFDDYKGYVYLWTGTDRFGDGGIFKIEPDENQAIMYRINSESPRNECAGEINSNLNIWGRRYLYTMTRLAGTTFRDRTSARIQKETGANLVRERDDFNDYRELYYALPPRYTTGETLGYVVSNAAMQQRIDEWRAWDADNQGSFGLAFYAEGVLYGTVQILCNFSQVESWDDVAQVIEDSIRDQYPECPDPVCRYVNGLLYLFAGPNAGDWPYVSNGAVGTSISGSGGVGNEWMDMNLLQATMVTSAHIVGGLLEPIKLPAERQWTHISMYASKSVAVRPAENFEVQSGQNAVNPEEYTWLADIPVAKAFTCELINGIVEAIEGRFSIHDIGSIIKFENGIEHELMVFIDETKMEVAVYTTTAEWIVGNKVTPEDQALQAACLGQGRVMTASQESDDIVRTSGDRFQATDVGKMIFWADGGESLIREYISRDKVLAWTRATREPQGATIDPIGRSFNDSINDDEIGYRRKNFPLLSRLWTPLPNYQLGQIVNAFFFVADLRGEVVYFSQMPLDYEFLAGHHYTRYQQIPIKDAIVALREMPDSLIIYCSLSTRGVRTNVINETRTPEVGDLIATLPSARVINEEVGAFDEGGIQVLDDGRHVVFTSKHEVRLFNGVQYGPNLAIDSEGRKHVQEALNSFQQKLASAYDPELGYMVWGSDQLPD